MQLLKKTIFVSLFCLASNCQLNALWPEGKSWAEIKSDLHKNSIFGLTACVALGLSGLIYDYVVNYPEWYDSFYLDEDEILANPISFKNYVNVYLRQFKGGINANALKTLIALTIGGGALFGFYGRKSPETPPPHSPTGTQPTPTGPFGPPTPLRPFLMPGGASMDSLPPGSGASLPKEDSNPCPDAPPTTPVSGVVEPSLPLPSPDVSRQPPSLVSGAFVLPPGQSAQVPHPARVGVATSDSLHRVRQCPTPASSVTGGPGTPQTRRKPSLTRLLPRCSLSCDPGQPQAILQFELDIAFKRLQEAYSKFCNATQEQKRQLIIQLRQLVILAKSLASQPAQLSELIASAEKAITEAV